MAVRPLVTHPRLWHVRPVGDTRAQHRFVGLDGLRGLAAIFVLGRHIPDHTLRQWFPGSYLAVDLFFLLSGFVLAHAYQQRFAEGLRVGAFMRLRFVRLYPLYLLALVIAVAALALRIYGGLSLDLWKYAAPLALALFFLPGPAPPGSIAAFPLNYPAWSLFYELAANLVFALFGQKLTTRVLIALIALGVGMLIVTARAFHGLDAGAEMAGFWGGAGRVTFAFFGGVGLYRLWAAGRFDKLKPPAWAGMALLVAAFAAPLAQRGLPDLITVIIIFPLILILGVTAPPKGGFARACVFLGAISYGFYVLQVPIMEVLDALLIIWTRHPLGWFGDPGTLVALLAVFFIAWIADAYFDGPVRRWLTRRLKRSASA